MRAMPPSMMAALVVTLAMSALSGGHTSDASPNTKRPTPTHTRPFKEMDGHGLDGSSEGSDAGTRDVRRPSKRNTHVFG